MAGHFIDVQFSVGGQPGTQAVTRKFRILEEGHKDLRGAFEAIADKFFKAEERGFKRGAIGHRWAPLAKSTLEYKSRWAGANANRILVFTGKMEDALTRKGARHQIFKITKKDMVIGIDSNTLSYPGYHMTGTRTKDKKRVKMPRRPVIPGIEYANDKDHIEAMKRWHFGMVREVFLK